MNTLLEYINSPFSVLQEIDFFIRIILACICGACIGFERTKRLKEAGIRTHIIVCCASALIMIVSKYGFVDPTDATGTFVDTHDSDRIAAQVVSGISFLGAGVIFKNGNTIKGLTTAAGIWATAGIGLAIGCGMFVIGIFCTVVIAVLQIIMHRFKIGGDSTALSHWKFTVLDRTGFTAQLNDFLNKHKLQIVESTVTQGENGSSVYDIIIRCQHDANLEEFADFMESKKIKSITCTPVL